MHATTRGRNKNPVWTPMSCFAGSHTHSVQPRILLQMSSLEWSGQSLQVQGRAGRRSSKSPASQRRVMLRAEADSRSEIARRCSSDQNR